MRKVFASLCLLTAASLPGCLQIDTGAGSDSGPGLTSTEAGAIAAAGDAAGGTGCGVDPTGSVTLCVTINACPALGVDPTAYANCGFRVGGAAPIDIECVCGTWLCPVGVARSCSDAAQLLAAQNALTVCEQANEGRCIALGATSDAGGGSGTCTADCRSQCAGVPDCLVACGC
jgi:hypothetical protein